MNTDDPITRFSDRADNYARYRPSYPPSVIDTLRDDYGLSSQSVVADVGSGTGILTRLLLPVAGRVYAVEPNQAMRQEAEHALAGHDNFVSIDARSEATTLAAASVDFITAAQAFHWFEPVATKVEFQRVLRPNGWVALVWNERDYQNVPLMRDYEAVLADFGLGYHAVRHRSHSGDINRFFTGPYQRHLFVHTMPLNFDAFWGGFLSASYAPKPADPIYEPMRERLYSVFEAHREGDEVHFVYQTVLNVGRV